MEALEKIIKLNARRSGICDKLSAVVRRLEAAEEALGVDLAEQKAYIARLAVEFGCGEVRSGG